MILRYLENNEIKEKEFNSLEELIIFVVITHLTMDSVISITNDNLIRSLGDCEDCLYRDECCDENYEPEEFEEEDDSEEELDEEDTEDIMDYLSSLMDEALGER